MLDGCFYSSGSVHLYQRFNCVCTHNRLTDRIVESGGGRVPLSGHAGKGRALRASPFHSRDFLSSVPCVGDIHFGFCRGVELYAVGLDIRDNCIVEEACFSCVADRTPGESPSGSGCHAAH